MSLGKVKKVSKISDSDLSFQNLLKFMVKENTVKWYSNTKLGALANSFMYIFKSHFLRFASSGQMEN